MIPICYLNFSLSKCLTKIPVKCIVHYLPFVILKLANITVSKINQIQLFMMRFLSILTRYEQMRCLNNENTEFGGDIKHPQSMQLMYSITHLDNTY